MEIRTAFFLRKKCPKGNHKHPLYLFFFRLAIENKTPTKAKKGKKAPIIFQPVLDSAPALSAPFLPLVDLASRGKEGYGVGTLGNGE